MRPRPASLSLLALALLSLPAREAALAQSPNAAPNAAPSAAPNAAPSAAPNAAPSAAPGPAPGTADVERPLGATPIPADSSKQPTPAEWAEAPEVRLHRVGPAAAGCRAYRLREWLRFRCADLTVAAISLLGGQTKGVAFWITPPKGSDLPRGGEVMFPLRPGDRRVVQFLTFGAGYDGPFTILPAVVLQEHWVEGDPMPTVIAR